MDVEDLILISGFSKLAICKSRLNAFNVVGGRKSIKVHNKPSSADSGEKASQAPFVVSLFAGINAECLLRALICCCRAGKQVSWKGATRCLLRARPAAGQGGDCWEARLRRGQLQGCGGTTRCLQGGRKAPRTKETLASPSPSPTTRPPTQSSAVRILIPEYLAAPSMATVALPPHTVSASFLPAPSPCSPLLSPEPGLQRGLVHPSSKWPTRPSREEGQSQIASPTRTQTRK